MKFRLCALLPRTLRYSVFAIRLRAVTWRRDTIDHLQVPRGRASLAYVCRAGLANRLTAHLAAANIAAATGRDLAVYWPRTRECAATFEELFASYSAPDCGERPNHHHLLGCDPNRVSFQSACDAVARRQEPLVLLDYTWQYLPGTLLRAAARNGGELSLAALRPHGPILEEVARTVAAWSPPVLGVHIRRGDFLLDGKAVPLERHAAALARSVACHPETKSIFIASDASMEELKPVLASVSLPVALRRSAGRDNLAAICGALVDLILLSRADRLILSPKSSFGSLAAVLGCVPSEVA